MQTIDINPLPNYVEVELFICVGIGKYNTGLLTVNNYDRSKHDKEFVLLNTTKTGFNIPYVDLSGKRKKLMEILQLEELNKLSIEKLVGDL